MWRTEALLGEKLLMGKAGKVQNKPQWRQKVSDLEQSLQSGWLERSGRRTRWASPHVPREMTAQGCPRHGFVSAA